MSNAEDFVERIVRIEGVLDCFLIRKDGRLSARPKKSSKNYSTLMHTCEELIAGITKTSGFGGCRYFCFNRENMQHFYVFFIDKFLLGLEQDADCRVPEMLEAVFRLIGRVSTGKSDVNQDRS